MATKKTILTERDTYVFIDVSNIKLACLKTLGLKINFVKLLIYLKRKYPSLIDVRYYEGIATGDIKKQQMFDFLRQKGYTICPLERKSYISVEVSEKEVKCFKCGTQWIARFTKEHKTMKSNVDVYLATELLNIAYKASKPTHIVLISCDGDYAEMIRSALKNENVSLSVLATPTTKELGKNTVSVRLKRLYSELLDAQNRYHLRNIANIADCFDDSNTS